MSEHDRYPADAGQAQDFLAGLRFDDAAPAPELPPADGPVTVSRTVRIPFEIDARIKAEADSRGVPYSVVFREWLAIGMAGQDHGDDIPVSRAEVQRVFALALSSLHPVKRSA